MPNIPKPELERGNFICYANKPGVVVGEGDGDYIAYANEPGTIADGGGGGGGGGGDFNVGELVAYTESNNMFGLAFLKYGDVVLYDGDLDAPYSSTHSFSVAMGLTIVMRLLDSASLEGYELVGVFYGESGNPEELMESGYTLDADTGYLTITIPTFEAEAPAIEPKFEYAG